jgi:hypothetical protein
MDQVIALMPDTHDSTAGAGHSDLGLDTDNQDFLVKDVYGVDSNVMHICKYRLSNGVSTTLLTLDWTSDINIFPNPTHDRVA